MLKNLKNKIRKNIQIFGLIFLIVVTIVSTSYFKSKNLRREVWTVKVTKNLSYTLQHHVNFILRIYMEASVRRF